MAVDVDLCQVWVGPLGTLTPVPNAVGELSSEGERPMSVQTAITGARTVQYAPLSRRTWKVSAVGLTPVERGAIEGAYYAANFPWTLSTIDAWRHNLLTPDQSLFKGLGTTAGPVQLPGDAKGRIPALFAPNRLVASSWAWVTIGSVPVLPDVPVTGSAWVKRWPNQFAFVAVVFRDGAGKVVAREDAYAPADDWERVTATAVAPAGAIRAELAVVVSEVAAPAITWTSTVADWSTGMGCAAAMPSPPAFSLNAAYTTARWDLTMTMTEVG